MSRFVRSTMRRIAQVMLSAFLCATPLACSSGSTHAAVTGPSAAASSGAPVTSSGGAKSAAATVDLAGTQPCDLVAQTDLERIADTSLPAHVNQMKHQTSDELAGIYDGPPFDLDVDVCVYTNGEVTPDSTDATGSVALAVGIATVNTGTASLDFMLSRGWDDLSSQLGKPAGFDPKKGVALIADASHILVTIAETSGAGGQAVDKSRSVELMRLVIARL